MIQQNNANTRITPLNNKGNSIDAGVDNYPTNHPMHFDVKNNDCTIDGYQPW